MDLLVRLFTLALRARDTVIVAWEMAQAEVRPFVVPDLCECGFALDDHNEDQSCPIEFEGDGWVVLLEDDDEEDE